MSAITTRAPAAAKRSTVARPMPLPPPVTTATFPASSSPIGGSSHPRSMPCREVPEHHGVRDARARAEVVPAHHRRGAVAGRVEAHDGLVLFSEDASVLVGDQTPARA